MNAMKIWVEEMLNLKHNREKIVRALKKGFPKSITVLDKDGRRYILKRMD